MKHFSFLLSLFLVAITVRAQVSLPAMLSNNAILQQRSTVSLWGKAKPSSVVQITTSWDEKTYKTKAGKDGNFATAVKTPVGGGPYTITFNDGVEKRLDNIMIGEVWFCSGQSNMAMTMTGNKNQPILHSEEIIAGSTNSQIRLFTTARKTSDIPLSDVGGSWAEATPAAVAKTSALAYQFAQKLQEKLKVPVGVIVSSWGGTPIRAWMSAESLQGISDPVALSKDKPALNPMTLYNGMVSPFVKYAVRGVLWYQGENDRLRPEVYRKMMPAMVKDWRAKFKNKKMPFYYVQIAPWKYPGDKGKEGGTFSFRLMQYELSKTIPNSGIAVTSDVGSDKTIHPEDKTSVAERLLKLALAKTYGYKKEQYLGPEMKDVRIDKNIAIVNFDHIEGALVLKGSEKDNFEIAGSDGVFHIAQARVSGDRLELQSDQVANPVAVRYGFKNYFKGNLFNKVGLPASSFVILKNQK